MKGLEPSTSWSLTRCATNCATSRFLIWDCKDKNVFEISTHFFDFFAAAEIMTLRGLFFDKLLENRYFIPIFVRF